MKVYGTAKWNINIEEKEITRMSGKTIFYLTSSGRENREAKSSSYRLWHDSKEAAIDYLLDRTQRKIKGYKEAIQEEQNNLEKLLALK